MWLIILEQFWFKELIKNLIFKIFFYLLNLKIRLYPFSTETSYVDTVSLRKTLPVGYNGNKEEWSLI